MKLLPNQLNRDREGAPTTYLITWVCYGSWLPVQSEAVPRTRNGFGARFAGTKQREGAAVKEPNVTRAVFLGFSSRASRADQFERNVLPPRLDAVSRACSNESYSRCSHRELQTEGILIAMKAYSSRALNKHEPDSIDRRRWARHDSTRYLWTRDAVQAAIRYVVHGQGEPMRVFEAPAPR